MVLLPKGEFPVCLVVGVGTIVQRVSIRLAWAATKSQRETVLVVPI